jgi:hypothetical protein
MVSASLFSFSSHRVVEHPQHFLPLVSRMFYMRKFTFQFELQGDIATKSKGNYPKDALCS